VLSVVPADTGSPAANKAAVCVPALDPAFLPSFKLPPLDHVPLDTSVIVSLKVFVVELKYNCPSCI